MSNALLSHIVPTQKNQALWAENFGEARQRRILGMCLTRALNSKTPYYLNRIHPLNFATKTTI